MDELLDIKELLIKRIEVTKQEHREAEFIKDYQLARSKGSKLTAYKEVLNWIDQKLTLLI